MTDLTAKQQRFIDEYLVDLNAADAARRAGYSEPTADQIGYENLRKPEIAAAIQAKMAQRARRVEAKADEVVAEYLALAFRDFRQILVSLPDGGVGIRPIADWPESFGKAIEGIKVKRSLEKKPDGTYAPMELLEFRLSSKIEALNALGRHLNLFTDKHELNIPDIDRLIALELSRLARGGQSPPPQTPPSVADPTGSSPDGNGSVDTVPQDLPVAGLWT